MGGHGKFQSSVTRETCHGCHRDCDRSTNERLDRISSSNPSLKFYHDPLAKLGKRCDLAPLAQIVAAWLRYLMSRMIVLVAIILVGLRLIEGRMGEDHFGHDSSNTLAIL